MNVPLLIRVFELIREDVKTDADLHRVVENILEIGNHKTLTMSDYDDIAKIPTSGSSILRHRRSRPVIKFRK